MFGQAKGFWWRLGDPLSDERRDFGASHPIIGPSRFVFNQCDHLRWCVDVCVCVFWCLVMLPRRLTLGCEMMVNLWSARGSIFLTRLACRGVSSKQTPRCNLISMQKGKSLRADEVKTAHIGHGGGTSPLPPHNICLCSGIDWDHVGPCWYERISKIGI